MTTIEIEPTIVSQIDLLTTKLRIPPSEFVNSALKKVLQQYKRDEIDAMYAAGYSQFPVQPDEFDVADELLEWGDE